MINFLLKHDCVAALAAYRISPPQGRQKQPRR